jgi:DNA primase
MARIPQDEIERLRSQVNVERLVEASGVELKRGGKDLVGRCPFHEDDTASLVVTPGKNLWHCFGCGVGGGPIDWAMKKNAVSFRHAVELLRAGLAAGSLEATGASLVRKLPSPVALNAGEQELLDQVIGYCRVASRNFVTGCLTNDVTRGFFRMTRSVIEGLRKGMALGCLPQR